MSLGGQAFWSLGGLMFVDSPEQRRCRVKDSYELALQDWMGTAAFDRPEDEWPRKWAEAYVGFCAGEKRAWLATRGCAGCRTPAGPSAAATTPTGTATRCRASTSPGGRARASSPRSSAACAMPSARASSSFASATASTSSSSPTGPSPASPASCSSRVSSPAARRAAARRPASSSSRAAAVIATTGGIGGNHDLVREKWPERLGEPPENMLSGVPAHVDGRMLAIARDAGASEINGDRMWHYVEGIHNWDPIWPRHAIRIIPGPSPMWFDATGKRLPGPLYPGYDTLGTLAHIQKTGHDYTWFVLTRKIDREGVRALGLRAEPGHHLGELARGAQGAPRLRAAVTRAGVHGQRRGLHRRARPERARPPDERAHRRGPDRRRRPRGPDHRARPRGRQPLRQGRPDHRDPRRPRLLGRPHHPRRRAAPRSSTRRRGR